jgi:DNA helicase-2/ATP-dependent DNA helicase PcrA
LDSKIEKSLVGLNPQQREAVTYGEVPLLIVAGAGTGKTKTLAFRVSYLLSQGIVPERILLLTFTRRAAEEMLKRATSVAAVDETLTRQVWGGIKNKTTL